MSVIYMGKIYSSHKAVFTELPPFDEDDFCCERCGTFEYSLANAVKQYQSRQRPILCASCSEAVTALDESD